MRRLLNLSLLLLTAASLHAQDITGIWQGHFRSNILSSKSTLLAEPRYKMEVQIAQKDKAFEAVTYSYLVSMFYGKAAASGTVNPKTGKVILQEVKLLEFRDEAGGGVCIMTCFMQYSKSGDEEFLEGTYTSMSVKDSSNCGKGTIFLRKVSTSDFYKEPFLAKREKEIAEAKEAPKAKEDTRSKTATTKKPVLTAPKPAPVAPKMTKPADAAKPKDIASNKNGSGTTKKPAPAAPPTPTPSLSRVNPVSPVQPGHSGDTGMTGIGKRFSQITPRVLQSRSNELVRTITVNTNEVVLNIYDDGAIDNDTISVYLDKKQVISHAMLTDKAIVLTLHLDESNDYHELVMVAENEGEIPPNTSLMIVKAGDKRYEVRITSTEQKNAVVVFKYEKP